jgi:hypothetical protein
MATDLALFLLTLSLGFITVGLIALLRNWLPTEPKLKDTAPPLLQLPNPPPNGLQTQYPPMHPLQYLSPPLIQPGIPLQANPYGDYQQLPQAGFPSVPMPPAPVLINDAYQVFHQRWSKAHHNWVYFNPSPQTQTFLAEALFIVYFRHESPGAGGHLRKVVEIRSPSLRTVLKGCLKSVEFVENAYHPLPSQYIGMGNIAGRSMPLIREQNVSFEQNPQVFHRGGNVDGRLMRRSCRLQMRC